jgi:hypothetical protein
MRTIDFLRAVVLTFAFVGMTYAQEGWKFPDFSATQVFQSRRGEMAMKVCRSGSSVRLERSAAISTLYATQSSTVYNLTTYPDNSHQCVSMKPEQARMLPSPLELIQGKVAKRVLLGSEVVEGHPTKIENVTVIGMDGNLIESKVWEADDLQGIPVKIESQIQGITLRAIYRDIAIGALDKVLFEVPGRCTPFEKMGQVAESSMLK